MIFKFFSFISFLETCQITYSRVEEPSHPETVWSTLIQPCVELLVTIQQVCKPETKGSAVPGNLENKQIEMYLQKKFI